MAISQESNMTSFLQKLIKIAAIVWIFVVVFTIGSHIADSGTDVTVDDNVDPTGVQHTNTSPQAVWTNDTDGYQFYIDSGGDAVMATSTDSGATWSAARRVDSINTTDAMHISVWYDQWTNGDSGTKIHALTFDNGVDDTYYTEIDTATGAISTTVITGTESGTLGTTNYGSITKAEDGDLYVTMVDGADAWVHTCSTTCTNGANWSAITNPWLSSQDGRDFPILLPLVGTDNIVLISWDISQNDIDSNVWSATSTSWWGWDQIIGTAEDNPTYDGGAIGATVNNTTGEIYLAHLDDSDDYVTADHDILIWEFDNSTFAWTQKTDVETNPSPSGLNEVKIAIDENTGDLYAIYNLRFIDSSPNTGRSYFKKSDDGGDTWGSRTTLGSVQDDVYGVQHNLMSDERLTTAWKYLTTPNAEDLEIDTAIVDLTPPAAGGGDVQSLIWF